MDWTGLDQCRSTALIPPGFLPETAGSVLLSPRSALDPSSSSTQDLPSPSDTGAVTDLPDSAPLTDEEAPAEGFVAATLAELGKVVWPSRQQLFSESLAVILMVSLSAAVIAAVGRFYSWLSGLVFR
ncbi:MAG: preprotein translocase subunit SecE [Synechococcaceae cyanobacterium]